MEEPPGNGAQDRTARASAHSLASCAIRPSCRYASACSKGATGCVVATSREETLSRGSRHQAATAPSLSLLRPSNCLCHSLLSLYLSYLSSHQCTKPPCQRHPPTCARGGAAAPCTPWPSVRRRSP